MLEVRVTGMISVRLFSNGAQELMSPFELLPNLLFQKIVAVVLEVRHHILPRYIAFYTVLVEYLKARLS